MTLFQLLVLVLPFSPLSSGCYFAGFPIVIKTPMICINCAFIIEIILFGMISELISRITRFLSILLVATIAKVPNISQFIQSSCLQEREWLPILALDSLGWGPTLQLSLWASSPVAGANRLTFAEWRLGLIILVGCWEPIAGYFCLFIVSG